MPRVAKGGWRALPGCPACSCAAALVVQQSQMRHRAGGQPPKRPPLMPLACRCGLTRTTRSVTGLWWMSSQAWMRCWRGRLHGRALLPPPRHCTSWCSSSPTDGGSQCGAGEGRGEAGPGGLHSSSSAALKHGHGTPVDQQPACLMPLLPYCHPLAPGRFHEKESLRRMVRAAADRPGVLYAFIVLDNPANSILDMQVGCRVGWRSVQAGQGRQEAACT